MYTSFMVFKRIGLKLQGATAPDPQKGLCSNVQDIFFMILRRISTIGIPGNAKFSTLRLKAVMKDKNVYINRLD